MLTKSKVKISACISAKDNQVEKTKLIKKMAGGRTVSKQELVNCVEQSEESDPWYFQVPTSGTDGQQKEQIAAFIVGRLASGQFKERE